MDGIYLSKRKQKQNHMTWLQLQKHNDCYVMKEIWCIIENRYGDFLQTSFDRGRRNSLTPSQAQHQKVCSHLLCIMVNWSLFHAIWLHSQFSLHSWYLFPFSLMFLISMAPKTKEKSVFLVFFFLFFFFLFFFFFLDSLIKWI